MERESTGVYISCLVVMAAILVLDLTVPLGVAVVILYNLVVLLALRSNRRRFIILIAMLATVLTIVPLFHKEHVDAMWKVVSNRTLALFSIWIESWLGLQRLAMQRKRENDLQERETALEEVRVLRGFLPICASCKKIRDLGGSWSSLEKYITEHSEAEFSHGLCPECTRRLFPQLFEAKRD